MKKTKKSSSGYKAQESPIIQIGVAFIVVAGIALLAYSISKYLPY
jgi:hypothetical protein